jgi:hypothetical protein
MTHIVVSPFGVIHEISKTYLGGGSWKPVTQLTSLERKLSSKAKWHQRREPSERPLSNRKIPTKGYLAGIGQVRVGAQQGKRHFMVYDRAGERRIVHRRNLGFRK